MAIEPSEILIASPPPLPRRPDLGSAGEQHRVSVSVGTYLVSGVAHVGPEARTVDEIATRQSFLPLTDAELTRESGEAGSEPERYAVLIVNLGMRRQ